MTRTNRKAKSNKHMDIIYMGTPDFAVGALKSLIEAGHNIRLVVTQPDRVRGRGREVSYSPVKECALESGIEVFQPDRIRDAESVKKLRSTPADVYVVAAFGQILSEEILNIPRYGCINIHASLLPKYRGAAPIQWCILNGESDTGVTIMQMDKGVDTGDILLQRSIRIDADETGGSLFDKLAALGAEMIPEALLLLEEGRLLPVHQDESIATHVGMLNKDMGRIDWSESADYIERHVRALNPWPGSYMNHNGRILKLWASHVAGDNELNDKGIDTRSTTYRTGTVLYADKSGIYVLTGDGVLVMDMIQPEGKRRMSAEAFLLGNRLETGTVLG